MKDRKISILFALSLVGLLVGYILTNSVLFNLCGADAYTCRDILNKIGDPLSYGMGALAVVFLILFFLPRAFSIWWKFAIWYVPLAIVVFVTARESHGWISLDPSLVPLFQMVSGLYVLVSLVLIGIVAFRKR